MPKRSLVPLSCSKAFRRVGDPLGNGHVFILHQLNHGDGEHAATIAIRALQAPLFPGPLLQRAQSVY